ncbi:SCO family protein [Methylomagnum ishizawai]|uniref:SCO family protein n=1 Tax=Methylomagnum ishizawai TaxID=1760988 RepID=UPI001C32002E|nr:SCO family protein [Methylomagnum ishizawai]BBL76881.1 SCO family protein [Methylomagnum ishizawai]
MASRSNSRPSRGWLALCACLAIAAGLSRCQPPQGALPELRSGVLLPRPRPLDPAGLVLDDGAPLADFLGRGRWTVVFTGYTHCPDACPTTLAQLARARSLPGAGGVRVLFLSVDPGRDTPERLGLYVRHFDPGFRAATGPAGRVAAFVAGLGAAFQQDGDGGNYRVDHSTALVLVDPLGRLAGYLTPPFTPETLAADLGAVAAVP